jgi:hypothetical protein
MPRPVHLAAALFMAGALASAAAHAQDGAPARRVDGPAERAPVERRLQSVKTLIESSSAARQIEASGKAEAQALRVKSRELARLAEEALASGDPRSAAGLLDEAARQMFEGVRLVTGEAKSENLGQVLATRMEATRALLAAQRRISAEKPQPGAAETARQIERLIEEAKAHMDARRYEQARPIVEQAYLTAKATIGAMRGGDTLVRSLTFASKEEEYHYELDRNDTHQMLLRLLAEKRPGGGGAGRDLVERAADLRRQAEASAARGDFALAIRLLEDSTRELVRAIRAAGVFIPG